MITDLTVGKPRSVLWSYSFPMFISVIFQQMYNLADSIIAGRYAGEDALAAVGASHPITMIYVAIATGCNIGCAVIISRLFGSKKFKDMKTAVSTTVITAVIISAVLTLFGVIFNTALMQMIKTPSNIFEQGKLYLDIYTYGFPFLFLYNIATGIFTALGDSKTPLYFLMGSSVGNILLDFIFVAVFDWGVAGVAWATFIAQGIACILSLIFLVIRLKTVGEKRERFSPFSAKMLVNIGIIAVPSILQQSFISVGNIFIQAVINDYGSPVIAGFSSAMKLNVVVLSAFSTFSNGLSAFTSQNLGANKPSRIREGYRAGFLLASGLGIFFAVTLFVFSTPLVNMFMPETTDTGKALTTGVVFLKIVAPFYLVISVKFICDGILRGMGAMTLFMTATFADLIIRVVLCYILAIPDDPWTIWLSWPIGWVLGTGLSFAFVQKKLRDLKRSYNSDEQ